MFTAATVSLICVAHLLLSSVAFAGTSAKTLVAVRTTDAVSIDGRLDDPAWHSAPVASGFLQFDPEEGAEPTGQTTVRLLYDDNALYVGVLCHDADPASIVKQLTRRDRSVQADRISVMIDSYHDHSTAFLFGGSVSGVQTDGLLSHDGRVYDVQWDAVWEFDAAVIPEGWSAEFRIPFSALRFTLSDSEYTWGINVRRYNARKKETDEWVMVPRSETPPGSISSVSLMGHLSGIRGINTPKRLEVMPYQVSRLSYLSQPQPFSLQRDFDGTAGLDLKYGLTNNFTLDVAVNPDFGQVEVDQAVLNLTVFETYYPEKRTFFLEGSPIFSFGRMFDTRQLQLFYSRRIGKRPFPSEPAADGYFYTESPPTTTILGAGKVTGRTDGGLSVGVLTALTEMEEGIQEDVNGNRLPPVLFEPRASYNVLRLKQDLPGNSSVGIMATGALKDQTLPSFSGGTDWSLRFDDGTYAIDGYLAGSRVFSAAGEARTGTSASIGLAKLAGEHWLAFSGYDFSTEDFQINDLGFFNQAREHGGYAQVGYKVDQASAPLRRFLISLYTDYRWNWDGVSTVKRIEFEPSVTFVNFWTLTLDYFHELPAYDDANRGIAGLYRRPAVNRLTATVQTDSRKPVVLAMHSGYRDSQKGMQTLFSALELTLRPSPWMEYAPAFTIVRTRSEEAWAIPYYDSDGRNIFGDRDVDQYDFSLRGTITFSRSLSMQFFTQVFLAKRSYENLRSLAGAETFVPYTAGDINPHLNEKYLSANFVLRWEYLPGSTFYLVWTQDRYGYNDNYTKGIGKDFTETFRLPMDNVLLAKVSYWWSL